LRRRGRRKGRECLGNLIYVVVPLKNSISTIFFSYEEVAYKHSNGTVAGYLAVPLPSSWI
jgi:hypothetical protein